jgi:hypothetical protein
MSATHGAVIAICFIGCSSADRDSTPLPPGEYTLTVVSRESLNSPPNDDTCESDLDSMDVGAVLLLTLREDAATLSPPEPTEDIEFASRNVHEDGVTTLGPEIRIVFLPARDCDGVRCAYLYLWPASRRMASLLIMYDNPTYDRCFIGCYDVRDMTVRPVE